MAKNLIKPSLLSVFLKKPETDPIPKNIAKENYEEEKELALPINLNRKREDSYSPSIISTFNPPTITGVQETMETVAQEISIREASERNRDEGKSMLQREGSSIMNTSKKMNSISEDLRESKLPRAMRMVSADENSGKCYIGKSSFTKENKEEIYTGLKKDQGKNHNLYEEIDRSSEENERNSSEAHSIIIEMDDKKAQNEIFELTKVTPFSLFLLIRNAKNIREK